MGIHDQINELIFKGDFSTAEHKAQAHLKEHPDDAESICALACVYRNQARKSGVIVNTDAMGIKEGEGGTYEMGSSSELSELFSEEVYYERDGYKKAEELYYKIIDVDPSYRNSYFNLLNDYVTLKEFDNYFKVINLFISNLKQEDGATDALNDLASKLFKQEYYDHALKLYTIIYKHYPDFHQARSDMGAIYINQGKITQAKAIFGEVYEKDPSDSINRDNYYLSCLLSEDFETAYRLNEAILKMEKNKTALLYDAAFMSFLLKKDYKSRLNDYIKLRATEVEDITKDFWYQTAIQLSEIDALEKKEKLSYLEYLLDNFNKHDFTGLVIIIANIIEQIEATNYALLVHGSIFDKYMFLDKTVEYLDKIKERSKSDPDIMSEYDLNWNYGRIYYTAEDYQTARTFLHKNYDVNKADARNNYYLAKCHLFLGDKKQAITLLNINKNMDDKKQMEFINYSIRELNKF